MLEKASKREVDDSSGIRNEYTKLMEVQGNMETKMAKLLEEKASVEKKYRNLLNEHESLKTRYCYAEPKRFLNLLILNFQTQ